MNKILITIQGRTLILYYQIKHTVANKAVGARAYIQVRPSDELLRFDLKDLTPEMFCVNIADMVNIRGLFSGQVENEKQLPVARWAMNYDEYREAIRTPAANSSHQHLTKLLEKLPGYMQESDNQYIDFEELVLPHSNENHTIHSGYRLTIMTEDIEGEISSYAYYNLDTHTTAGWQSLIPTKAEHEAIQNALNIKLQTIRDAGVYLTHVYDETDYDLDKG